MPLQKEKPSSSIKETASSSSASRTATRRLLKELAAWRAEQSTSSSSSSSTAEGGENYGIERLGPVRDDDLMSWEAVMHGRGLGYGYDAGRWLLSVRIPDEYPLRPPVVRFATPVVHPNVSLPGGDVCLDLLSAGAGPGAAWTPACGVAACVRAVRALLALPATDSPLNVDVAALLRDGDAVGARRLVELWCGSREGRYEGD